MNPEGISRVKLESKVQEKSDQDNGFQMSFQFPVFDIVFLEVIVYP
jgi:hypothetical protein